MQRASEMPQPTTTADAFKWRCLDPATNEESGDQTASQILRATREGTVSPHALVRLLPTEWTTAGKMSDAWKAVCTGPRVPQATFYFSYLDPHGHEHGPWSAGQMDEWSRSGWFAPATRVRAWPHGWVELRYCRRMLDALRGDAPPGDWCVVDSEQAAERS